jgi:hypothetical protein
MPSIEVSIALQFQGVEAAMQKSVTMTDKKLDLLKNNIMDTK